MTTNAHEFRRDNQLARPSQSAGEPWRERLSTMLRIRQRKVEYLRHHGAGATRDSLTRLALEERAIRELERSLRRSRNASDR